MSTDLFVSTLLKAQGRTIVNPGSVMERNVRGVPVRPLMLQRMLGTDVLVLSKIVEMAGPTGSCKSALLFHLMREFLEQGCLAVLVESENKFNPAFFSSILGPYADSATVIDGCTTLEKYQSAILDVVKAYKTAHTARGKELADWEKSNKKDKGERPSPMPPLLLGLDSLTVSSEESMKSIDTDGHASRQFPAEALFNSRFFATLPDKLEELPITFIYTNHRMQAMQEGGGKFGGGERTPEARSKGGATPAFYAGLRLFFEEAGTVVKPRNNVSRQTLVNKVIKNSFHQKGTRSMLDMEWTNVVDEAAADSAQITEFRWDEALVKYLAPAKGPFDYDREAVKTFLAVTFHSLTNYSCKGEINMENATARELGEAIEARPDVCWRLAPYLGIKRFPAYEGLVKPHAPAVKADVAGEAEAVEAPAEEAPPAKKSRSHKAKRPVVVEPVEEESDAEKE